jgi:hypothetical protein
MTQELWLRTCHAADMIGSHVYIEHFMAGKAGNAPQSQAHSVIASIFDVHVQQPFEAFHFSASDRSVCSTSQMDMRGLGTCVHARTQVLHVARIAS